MMLDVPSRGPVWDLPLRLFHWSLLLAVLTAAVSGFLLPLNWLNLHLIAGTAIIVLLFFRLVWGFTGSSFSRFSSFVFSPSTVLAHARALRKGETPFHAGHNPVGSVMIFALLGMLTLLTVTGVIVLGGADKQGVLRALISYATGSSLRQIHEILAYGLLALVLGHVAGVIFESRRSGINLARSMVTGDKPLPEPLAIAPPRIGAALVGLSMTMLVAGYAAFALWRLPTTDVPQNALDAAYEKQCGDCHIPFHPSLRGRGAWTAIMTTLDDHFGEDASLPADELARLSDYLTLNAAERWDTRAANVFRDAEPLRITDTIFWKRRHADIDPAQFQTKKVGAKSNCEACHGDARTGLFSAQAINIPQE